MAMSTQSCHRCPGPLWPQPCVQLTSSYGSCQQIFQSQSVSLPHQGFFHWFHWGLQVLLPSSNTSLLPLTEPSMIWTPKTHIVATGELLSKPSDSYACCWSTAFLPSSLLPGTTGPDSHQGVRGISFRAWPTTVSYTWSLMFFPALQTGYAEPQGQTESRLMKMAEPVSLNSWREHKLLCLSWGSCYTDTVDRVTCRTEIHYLWFWEIQDEGAGQFSSWWGPSSWFADWCLRCCVLKWWRERASLFSWAHVGQFSHVQLFVTPWTVCSPAGSSVQGILQATILEWVAMPPPGDLPDPGIKPMYLMSPAMQASSLPLLFLKALIRFLRAPSSWPNCLPRVHLPIPHAGD